MLFKPDFADLFVLLQSQLGLHAFPQQPAGPEADKGAEDGQGARHIRGWQARGKGAQQAHLERYVADRWTRGVRVVGGVIPKRIQHGEAIVDCVPVISIAAQSLRPPQCNSRTRLAIDEE